MQTESLEKFDKWNEDKKAIHSTIQDKLYVNPRDIWFVKLWINIWFEENWKKEFRRPVLVLKKVWNLFFVVALTSKWKENNKFYHKLFTSNFNEKNQKHKDESFCILSQVKIIDKKRFTEHIWYIWEIEFEEVKEKLRDLIL